MVNFWSQRFDYKGDNLVIKYYCFNPDQWSIEDKKEEIKRLRISN